MGLRYGTVITPQADSKSWQRSLKRCFWFMIINEWLCNMQLFPKIWILEISKKAFRISGSVSGSRLIAVFGYPYPVANSLSCRISNRPTR